jgi:hypothetical protein
MGALIARPGPYHGPPQPATWSPRSIPWSQVPEQGATVELQGDTQVNGKPVTTAGKLVVGACPPTGGPLIAENVMPCRMGVAHMEALEDSDLS